MSHYCHVPGCEVEIQPRYLMCLAHWRRVPFRLKQVVWKHYQYGQEATKSPTIEYLNAAKAAIQAVAARENQ